MTNLCLKNISKRFGDKNVLKHWNLTIAPGETIILMGKSGCGKTMLLHLIAGLLQPEEGEITGVPERFSMVFQEDRLCEWETVRWNLRLVCDAEDGVLRQHCCT